MRFKPSTTSPALQVVLISVLTVLTHATLAASPPWMTAHDSEINVILGEMTLAEKIGQMTQPDVSAVKDLNDITTLALGSWTPEPVVPGATISYTFTPSNPTKKFVRLKVTQP